MSCEPHLSYVNAKCMIWIYRSLWKEKNREKGEVEKNTKVKNLKKKKKKKVGKEIWNSNIGSKLYEKCSYVGSKLYEKCSYVLYFKLSQLIS